MSGGSISTERLITRVSLLVDVVDIGVDVKGIEGGCYRHWSGCTMRYARFLATCDLLQRTSTAHMWGADHRRQAVASGDPPAPSMAPLLREHEARAAGNAASLSTAAKCRHPGKYPAVSYHATPQ